ncbi:hypothetical protein B0T19DRAFT_95590 [Cercophora scortea]|uniref:Uncharacterized protein n=1 Tax=Cercophora scortea TaxID=314031 RepID=A0AAE0MGY2_9PEZI|nr:hypothetical protein B0T19DRAFT_95590 [Cercophora scortea]
MIFKALQFDSHTRIILHLAGLSKRPWIASHWAGFASKQNIASADDAIYCLPIRRHGTGRRELVSRMRVFLLLLLLPKPAIVDLRCRFCKALGTCVHVYLSGFISSTGFMTGIGRRHNATQRNATLGLLHRLLISFYYFILILFGNTHINSFRLRNGRKSKPFRRRFSIAWGLNLACLPWYVPTVSCIGPSSVHGELRGGGRFNHRPGLKGKVSGLSVGQGRGSV